MVIEYSKYPSSDGNDDVASKTEYNTSNVF